MSFRKIVQAEAKRRGVSGYRLAKESGVAMRSVQAFLAGESDMASENVFKVAAVLGLELRPKRRRVKKGK